LSILSEKEAEKSISRSNLREYAEAIIIAILLALIIRAFIVQAFKIPSGSMKPTLLIGDHILVNKFIYGIKIPFWNKELIHFSDPKRQDIIVFRYPVDPSKDFIKESLAYLGIRYVYEIKSYSSTNKGFKNPTLFSTTAKLCRPL